MVLEESVLKMKCKDVNNSKAFTGRREEMSGFYKGKRQRLLLEEA